MSERIDNIVDFIRRLYGGSEGIPLHAPCFAGNEKRYLAECIDSTFVSSVGPFVDRFERMMEELTGAKYAVATTNGTSALHMALILAGVRSGDEVITQALSFVATANAIAYQHAHPVFIDVDVRTCGLSPIALETFLNERCEMFEGNCRNKRTGRRIAAVVPMHVFGHPAAIEDIVAICERWGIPVVEDAAESLGSYAGGRHTGTFGLLGAFSFNGNKTVTCGGGGCIVTNDFGFAKRAKHLTTTAKVPHRWEFQHDEVGYNYRLPNINAALACAQLEMLDAFVANKRETAAMYRDYCASTGMRFLDEPADSRSNFWLCAVLTSDLEERNLLLERSNAKGVMTRPVWKLLNSLPAFTGCETDSLKNSRWLEERLVNVPSSVRAELLKDLPRGHEA